MTRVLRLKFRAAFSTKSRAIMKKNIDDIIKNLTDPVSEIRAVIYAKYVKDADKDRILFFVDKDRNVDILPSQRDMIELVRRCNITRQGNDDVDALCDQVSKTLNL
jgi:acetolactate synthase regulatory subunit